MLSLSLVPSSLTLCSWWTDRTNNHQNSYPPNLPPGPLLYVRTARPKKDEHFRKQPTEKNKQTKHHLVRLRKAFSMGDNDYWWWAKWCVPHAAGLEWCSNTWRGKNQHHGNLYKCNLFPPPHLCRIKRIYVCGTNKRPCMIRGGIVTLKRTGKWEICLLRCWSKRTIHYWVKGWDGRLVVGNKMRQI